MTRAEVNAWTGDAHKVARIFDRWVCWPMDNRAGFWNVRFAYVGDYVVNNGFAYRKQSGELMTPNDWECHPPKAMMQYLNRILPA